jgi:DNA-binding response OmpR family regulator
MRLLLVEDNRRLGHSLKASLVDHGYLVDVAFDGVEGQHLAETINYDLIILETMLPERDGIEVCRELRRQKINAPILMLIARESPEDQVRAHNDGVDDFLTKPFAIYELITRLHAMLHRGSPDKPGLLRIADLSLDPEMYQVTRGGVTINLTAKEFSLLEYIMRHPNRLITRRMAENYVWSYDYNGASNVVDVYIRRLRRKIDEPFNPKLIETVRGAGYRMRNPTQ